MFWMITSPRMASPHGDERKTCEGFREVMDVVGDVLRSAIAYMNRIRPTEPRSNVRTDTSRCRKGLSGSGASNSHLSMQRRPNSLESNADPPWGPDSSAVALPGERKRS